MSYIQIALQVCSLLYFSRRSQHCCVCCCDSGMGYAWEILYCRRLRRCLCFAPRCTQTVRRRCLQAFCDLDWLEVSNFSTKKIANTVMVHPPLPMLFPSLISPFPPPPSRTPPLTGKGRHASNYIYSILMDKQCHVDDYAPLYIISRFLGDHINTVFVTGTVGISVLSVWVSSTNTGCSAHIHRTDAPQSCLLKTCSPRTV